MLAPASPPLRVLFVTGMHAGRRFPLRGIVVRRLADALGKRGHVIRFVEAGEKGGPLRYFRMRSNTAAAVKEFRPNLIHVHFGYSGLAIPHVSIPVVVSFYGDDLNGTWRPQGGLTLTSRIGIVLSQLTALRSQCCITVSRPLRDRLWFTSSRKRTTIIRDSVDTTLFHPISRDEARRRLGLEPAARLILFPHDISQPTKRLSLAEAAVAELRHHDPAARLWIVNGRAPNEMPWYYAASDAMIVTSVREGGPSSVKEALACGLPVVSVRVGDVDLFDEVPDGVVEAAANPVDLSRKLIHALRQTPAARQSLLPDHLHLDHAIVLVERVYADALRSLRL